MRNCASACRRSTRHCNMLSGRSNLVLAGGLTRSRACLLYSDMMVMWFSTSWPRRPAAEGRHVPEAEPTQLLTPHHRHHERLTDPYVGLLMGQTAENLAYRFGSVAGEMDEFAADSHARVRARRGTACSTLRMTVSRRRSCRSSTTRETSTRRRRRAQGFHGGEPGEAQALFRPEVRQRHRGNSSQITDGAAWLVLATEEAVQTPCSEAARPHRRFSVAGLDPAQMGLGPVHAATPILKRHRLELNDPRRLGNQRSLRGPGARLPAAWREDKILPRGAGLDGALG